MSKEGKTLILLVIAGIISSYFVVVPRYFPYLGFSLFSFLVLTFIYFCRNKRDWFFTASYLLGIVFCIFLILRANPVLTFLNLATIFYIGTVLVLYRGREEVFTFGNIWLSPLLSLKEVFGTGTLEVKEFKRIKEFNGAGEIGKSIGITIAVLALIIPLLASANPVFAKLVNFQWLIDFFLRESIFIWLIRIIFFVIFVMIGARTVVLINNERLQNRGKEGFLGNINYIIPKAASALVIFVFFLTQLQFYLAGGGNLTGMGHSNSTRTNEVFFQLSLVCLVIFGLIYNDRKREKTLKSLTYTLFLEVLFLTAIAFKSDYDYVSLYGFTQKRLWGFTALLGTLGVLGILGKEYLREFRQMTIIRNVCLLWAGLLIIVNIANFDYLIAKIDRSISYMGVDYLYLSSLSSDSESYKETMGELGGLIKKDRKNPLNQEAFYKVWYKSLNLQNKYKEFDLRIFNLAEYREYLKIKNIDLKKLEKYWDPNYIFPIDLRPVDGKEKRL